MGRSGDLPISIGFLNNIGDDLYENYCGLWQLKIVFHGFVMEIFNIFFVQRKRGVALLDCNIFMMVLDKL